MSLAALFAEHGTSADAVASALGLDPALFDRFEDRSQPFPLDLADEVAVVAGVGVADVIGAAFSVTTIGGPAARRPRPSPPLSTAVRPVVYAKTQEVET